MAESCGQVNSMERVRSKEQSGFFLIEAVVAFLLLAFTTLGLSSFMLTTIETNRDARRITAATNLAQDKLEELRGLSYTAVVSGSDGEFNEEGGTTGSRVIYSRSWTVIDDSPEAGLKSILVQVGWIDKKGDRDVSLQTIIFQ